jgi:uncharacterized protein
MSSLRLPVAVVITSLTFLVFTAEARQSTPPPGLSGQEVMERVNARKEGQQASRTLALELAGRDGSVRSRTAITARKYYGKDSKSILIFAEPADVRGTGLLMLDYADPAAEDGRWVYLPAMRKIRTLFSSERGAYFFGTDLSYEDINQEQKVSLTDYAFKAKGKEKIDGIDTLVVEGTPVNKKIAAELGYSKVVWRVEPGIWMWRKGDYYDIAGDHLKTITLERVEVISGIQTAMQVYVENHKTGQTTRLAFTKVDYESPISDAVFSQERLARGF